MYRILGTKILRRHPHVFGDLAVSGVDEVLANWETIKSAERREIEEDRLNTIRSTGYSRWYEELKSAGEIWIDTQLQLASQPAV